MLQIRELPSSLSDASPDLIDLWYDFAHFFNEVAAAMGYDALVLEQSTFRQVVRVASLGLAALVTFRERRTLRKLLRLSGISQYLSRGDWDVMADRKEVCEQALTWEEWEIVEDALNRFRRNHLRPPTSAMATAFNRIHDVVKRASSRTVESIEQHSTVFVPNSVSYLQPFFGKAEKGVSVRGGRIVISVPGYSYQLTLSDFGAGETEESSLTQLQRLVSRFNRPGALKVMVGSLHYHQIMVERGMRPDDVVRVNVNDLLDLIRVKRRPNGSHDIENKRLVSFTFWLMSQIRAEWIPDLTRQATGIEPMVEWTPLYVIHGGRDRLPDRCPEVIEYQIGRYFLAALTSDLPGTVAFLDYDLFYSWSLRSESHEQLLHLCLSQMFWYSLKERQGIIRDTVRNIMIQAGLTTGEESGHVTQQVSRFYVALDKLKKHGVIAEYKVYPNPEVNELGQIVEIYPPDELRERFRQITGVEVPAPLAAPSAS